MVEDQALERIPGIPVEVPRVAHDRGVLDREALAVAQAHGDSFVLFDLIDSTRMPWVPTTTTRCGPAGATAL